MLEPSISSSKNGRIEHIDILRGLCMVLIVWYHTDHPNILNYPFYNTTLFFVSGLLYKPCTWKLFVANKFHKLIIPFFFFYSIYYIFLVTLNLIKFHTISPDIYLSFFDVIKCYKDNDAFTCNYPLWFIWALLWVQIQASILIKIIKNPVFIFIISLIVSTIGFRYLQHIPTPLILGRSTTFLVYYVAGYITRDSLIHSKQGYRIFLVSALLWFFLTIICHFSLGPLIIIPFDILQDILFSILLLQLSKSIHHISIHDGLVFIGINSIIIFGIHDMYLTTLRIITSTIWGGMNSALGCTNWIITLLLMVPTIYFFNQFFPSLIGKKRITEECHLLP